MGNMKSHFPLGTDGKPSILLKKISVRKLLHHIFNLSSTHFLMVHNVVSFRQYSNPVNHLHRFLKNVLNTKIIEPTGIRNLLDAPTGPVCFLPLREVIALNSPSGLIFRIHDDTATGSSIR